ncbi:hypothetical protein CBM2587_A100103 [Cupriavidus taiwanensis]|uniref:Uncharacterized protein n=1 Tax=Cupriavidus taiwanensis TaxID=164546 RepID=A0A975ZXP4_9BURK|nr:hypothetical protein CBM2587_A100103 [Cupriavidus taiwanensis]
MRCRTGAGKAGRAAGAPRKHRPCHRVQRLYDGSIRLPIPLQQREPENRHVRPSQPSPD